MVNVYLVEDDRGVTVIDAGLPGQWQELLSELTAMGRTLDDIKGLILTHGDSDHLGFAERLRTDAGVDVFVHEDDQAQVTGQVKKKNPSWGPVRPGPLFSFLWYAARKGGLKVPTVTTVTTVRDGDVLDLPGDPVVIHTPGHSPGSIALYSAGADALFAGDAMTTRHVLTGAAGPQPSPFTLEPGEALHSLDRWNDIDARWVLPGHGPPWDDGVASAVALIRSFDSS